jgi:hypothetical protein
LKFSCQRNRIFQKTTKFPSQNFVLWKSKIEIYNHFTNNIINAKDVELPQWQIKCKCKCKNEYNKLCNKLNGFFSSRSYLHNEQGLSNEFENTYKPFYLFIFWNNEWNS